MTKTKKSIDTTIGKWTLVSLYKDEAIELTNARLIAAPPKHTLNAEISRYWVPAWLEEAVELYRSTKPADLTLTQYIRIMKDA